VQASELGKRALGKPLRVITGAGFERHDVGLASAVSGCSRSGTDIRARVATGEADRTGHGYRPACPAGPNAPDPQGASDMSRAGLAAPPLCSGIPIAVLNRRLLDPQSPCVHRRTSPSSAHRGMELPLHLVITELVAEVTWRRGIWNPARLAVIAVAVCLARASCGRSAARPVGSLQVKPCTVASSYAG
jgi:hypothetical protein